MPLTAIPQIAQIPGLQAALDAKAALAGAAFTGAVSIGNGTVVASAPALTLSQTWNNAAVDFTAALVNVSNTASGSGSKLHDWQVSGVSQVSIFKDGKLGIRTASWGQFVWQQQDTYGFGLKSPDNNWVFCGQNDGGLAALSICAASNGRLAFKNTTFHAGAVWQNQSVGFERDSDDQVKVTAAGGALRDLKLRTLKQTETMEIDDLGSTPDAVAGKAVLWVENNGSGKLQLLVRFPSGAPQLIKIEP